MPSSDPTDAGNIDADELVPESPVETPSPANGHVSRRIDPDERASTAVLLAIAAATDADPTALSPPMHEAIDAEALDRLVDRAPAEVPNLRIELELYGCRIAVTGDRRIDVRRIA